MLSVGQKVGPFFIEKELGSGAMGTVYRVRYEKDNKIYALKVISIGLTGNETALARFEREHDILKQLKHPNIVRNFASGRYKGVPFFAMEYIKGESLDRIALRRARFSWQEVVEMGKQVAAALQHAHDKGIIHRDLKPSNLMRLDDGTVKLTDFGIAKDMDMTALTGANATVGTAAYMSPEQCCGAVHLTAKSDLYSLGVVFFELLTGRKPFVAESPIDMFMKHVHEPPPRPSRLVDDMIPIWLDTLVLQMLEKQPEHRPMNAEMVEKALDEVMANVNSGKSAAVDAVQARAIDRRYQSSLPDDADRDAARSLRSAAGRKKTKRKGGGRGLRILLQAAGLLFLLLIVGVGIAVAVRPPSADDLYRRAEKMMEKEESYDAAWARIDGKPGPVSEFIRRYPDDPRIDRVRDWADTIQFRDFRKRLEYNAKKPKLAKPYGFDLDPNYEEIAFRAFRYEEFADIWYSKQYWKAARNLIATDPQSVAYRFADRRYKEWLTKWEPRPDMPGESQTYCKKFLAEKLTQVKDYKKNLKIKDADEILRAIVDLYSDKQKEMPIEPLVKEATDLLAKEAGDKDNKK
jgi:tRNA A-37 threonylcarbamoyl transferase component Bud32